MSFEKVPYPKQAKISHARISGSICSRLKAIKGDVLVEDDRTAEILVI